MRSDYRLGRSILVRELEGDTSTVTSWSQQNLHFGGFRLDLANNQLWRGKQLILLRPKSLAVLCYLAENSGRLVSREELHQHLWEDTVVTKVALRVCIREIRQALEDDAAHPQFIETVGKSGYRFLSEVQQETSSSSRARSLDSPQLSRSSLFVGREEELAHLHDWLARVRHGQRQLLFVAGEAGVGKSALVQRFVERLQESQADAPAVIATGQCVELYGDAEAYLPLLDALRQLAHALTPPVLAALLRQHAPSWLTLLPTLLPEQDRASLLATAPSASPERYLRELADVFEIMATMYPFLLVLEDLQWSDTATLAFLSALSRRTTPGHLPILCTYRPTETLMNHHPLRRFIQELRAHGRCGELRLELLTEEDVKLYVRQRLGESALAEDVGAAIHLRSDGNALFMVAMLESLIDKDVLVEHEGQWRLVRDLDAAVATVPDNVYQLLLKQIEALSAEEQEILAIASVEGRIFSAAAVAAGAERPLEAVEVVCDRLVQCRHFIESHDSKEWSDDMLSVRYQFLHALHRHVFYEWLGEGQRRRTHRRIGEYKEAAYRERTMDIAGELALHFTNGRAYAQALQYHQYAAENVLRRGGYQEAMRHCEAGLALTPRLPASTDRARQELALRLPLATAQGMVQGFSAADLRRNLTRAQELSKELGDLSTLVPILINVGRGYMERAERAATTALAKQESRLLKRLDDPPLVASLAVQLGNIALLQGAIDNALKYFHRAQTLSDDAQEQVRLTPLGLDPLTLALIHSSHAAWLSGHIDQARQNMKKSLIRAQKAQPAIFFNVLLRAAITHQLLREPIAVKQLAHQALIVANKHGITLYKAEAEIVHTVARLHCGDLKIKPAILAEQIRAYRATGAQLLLPFYLSFLAEAYWREHNIEDGLRVLKEALQLTATNLDCFWEAELYRLQGELLLARKSSRLQVVDLKRKTREAETCFLQATEVARRQGAKALELRAVMSLSRLWQQQGKKAKAHHMLAEIYGWFTEGFDAKDLQEAKALLDELADGMIT